MIDSISELALRNFFKVVVGAVCELVHLAHLLRHVWV